MADRARGGRMGVDVGRLARNRTRRRGGRDRGVVLLSVGVQRVMGSIGC